MKNIFAIKTNFNYYIYVLGKTNNLTTVNKLIFEIVNYFTRNNIFEANSIYNCKTFASYTKEDLKDAIRFIDSLNKSFPIDDCKNKCSYNGIDKEVEIFLSDISHITLEVTEECNIACKYCAYGDLYHKQDKRESKKMRFKHAKHLIDYLIGKRRELMPQESNVQILISFYGGEPLLETKFIKRIIDYVKFEYSNVDFDFSITTNGMLIKKEAEFLVENNIDISVSLDGDNKNNTYRVGKNGKSTFEIVERNLSYFENNYPKYFEEKINFVSVLHNKNSVEDINTYLDKRFGKSSTISALNTYGILDSKKSEFSKMFKDHNSSYNEMIGCSHKKINSNIINKSPIKAVYNELVHEESGRTFLNYSDTLLPIEESNRINTATCYPFQSGIFLTANGKILPCESIDFKYAFGEVDDNGLNINTKEVSQVFKNRLKDMLKQCSHCYFYRFCSKCVYNIITEGGICNKFMDYEDFQNYLKMIISEVEKLTYKADSDETE